jgi:hypothetical protein
MCAFMAACWGLHKKGNPYEGLLRALTTAAETRHEQERLQGAFVKRGNFHEGLWGVYLWVCVLASQAASHRWFLGRPKVPLLGALAPPS